MNTHYLTINLLRAIAFGLAYSILEVNVPLFHYIPVVDYRVFYLIIFAIANMTLPLSLFLGNFFLSMASEDMFYWIIKAQTPFQYAWYYPVIDGIPIADVIEVIISVFSYYYYVRHHNETTNIFHFIFVDTDNTSSSQQQQCGMWYAFTHGKAHDEYGALTLVLVSVLAILSSHSLSLTAFATLSLIVGTGIFVDLWAHCFHH
ncbi:hypothetical protein [Deltalipothrixvirus pozzuoliense]|uniref:Putative transmembrane protein ORF202 n=1 Tax=Acidianus filamentous virus 2 (isolate Italy/Pozzuoli) TaxID=654910 RepID=Y202_AFV2P|nr:hypothetical protein AFV2_gp49 [Acidianus filamentous virus 2]Q573C0.1 RecName: Full=Putative transmembrane protein ORF202 [Acidianus filamentous virus 2 (isolate Pozzuoli)]CAH69436.1 hypothetical protein [Acidianus filamentous virus 2]